MDKNRVKEEFILFLIENKCFDEYLENCESDKVPDYTGLDVIAGSFAWANSEQGFDYWSDIDNKWERRYRELGEQARGN